MVLCQVIDLTRIFGKIDTDLRLRINRAPKLNPQGTEYLRDGEIATIIQQQLQGVTQSTLVSVDEKTAIQDRLALIPSKIAGKKSLSVRFTSSEGDLIIYYVVDSSSTSSCSVKHLDYVLDDFDNG